MHLYLHLYLSIYVYLHLYTYICIYLYIHLFTYHIFTYIYTYTSVYVYAYLCFIDPQVSAPAPAAFRDQVEALHLEDFQHSLAHPACQALLLKIHKCTGMAYIYLYMYIHIVYTYLYTYISLYIYILIIYVYMINICVYIHGPKTSSQIPALGSNYVCTIQVPGPFGKGSPWQGPTSSGPSDVGSTRGSTLQ